MICYYRRRHRQYRAGHARAVIIFHSKTLYGGAAMQYCKKTNHVVGVLRHTAFWSTQDHTNLSQ